MEGIAEPTRDREGVMFSGIKNIFTYLPAIVLIILAGLSLHYYNQADEWHDKADTAAIGIGAVVAAMALSGSLSGKRKNGGPVSAGSMYQVGEGGMPEIYQAGTGKQYMIPGDNGKVISNKDMQGSGSAPNVSIQFIDQSTGRKSFDAQSSMSGNNLTVTAFISDLEEGGPMSQSITRNTTASRRANG